MKIADPSGVRWRVSRRWWLWRRRITLAAVWRRRPGGGDDDLGVDLDFDITDLLLFIPLVVYLVFGLFAWLAELGLALLFLPFTVLARLIGLGRWPVDVARARRHDRTVTARSLPEAANLEASVGRQIQAGSFV